uniref:CCDC113/CCDC96 coiled-coil domain-containing protein n=2 Tax=Clastoptera arizonana TaxID=38151 RepID=A0A1B6DLU2_9HEMI
MDIPKNIDNDTIDTKISNEEITQDNSINISKNDEQILNEENFVENETNDKKEFEIVSESKINVDGPDYEKLSNDILVAREDDIDKTNGQNKTFFEEGQETNNENQIIEIKTEDTIKDHEKLEDNSLQENDNQYHFEETASIKETTPSEVELEEDYEEEETDEDGNVIIVIKRRAVRKNEEISDNQEKSIDDEENIQKKEVEEEEELGEIEIGDLEEKRGEEDEEEERPVREMEIEEGRSIESAESKKSSEIDIAESRSLEILLRKRIEEEEHKKSLTEEEKELKTLRDTYSSLLKEQQSLGLKNTFLKKRMIKYLKNKKGNNAISVSNKLTQDKTLYSKKLLEFAKKNEIIKEERKSVATKLELLKGQNEDDSDNQETFLKELFDKQRSIGNKLMYVKTGKLIKDEVINDLITRQKIMAEQMYQVRLECIKVRNKVIAMKELVRFDHMGSDFQLMDYEKLCIEKEDFSSKIVDRDLEVQRVKKKTKDMYESVKQMEIESEQLQEKIHKETEKLHQLEINMQEIREKLNYLKEQRYHTLEDTARMKQNSGLLTMPTLLADFEETKNAVKEASQQLKNLKMLYEHQKQNIKKLKDILNKKKSFLTIK